MMRGDFVDQRQLVAGGDLRMRRQRLLHQRGAGAREAEDEDRLRRIGAHAGARQSAQPAGGEEVAQPVDLLPRRRRPGTPGRTARAPAACPRRRRPRRRRSGPSGRAAGPSPAVRSGRACASPADGASRSAPAPRRTCACRPSSTARVSRTAGIVRESAAPSIEHLAGGVEIAGRLPPAARSRAGSGGCRARRRRIPGRARALPPCGPGSSGSRRGWRAGSDRAAPLRSSTRR